MNDTITADVQIEEIVADVAPVEPTEGEQTGDERTSDAPAEGGAEETANVATAEDRYPAKPVRDLLAERLRAAHVAGWTRPKLTELIKQVKISEPAEPSAEGDGFYMGGSALFRTGNGNVHTGEVQYLTAVLDWIDAGVVQLPEKITKNPAKLQERLEVFEARVASLQAALDGVRQAAEASSDVKGVGALREVLADIAKIAGGEGDQA
jgi:hypothetical protein